jgi:hypothetical protein
MRQNLRNQGNLGKVETAETPIEIGIVAAFATIARAVKDPMVETQRPMVNPGKNDKQETNPMGMWSETQIRTPQT